MLILLLLMDTSLLDAASDPRFRSRGWFRGKDAVEIADLCVIKGYLWVLGIMVNLHRLNVWCCDLTVWALKLGMSTLYLSCSISLTRLASASIRCGRVNLGLDFLSSVLLWLCFPCHGWRASLSALSFCVRWLFLQIKKCQID